MRTLAAFALAVSAAATPALAQESDFTGPRVDVAVGYDNIGSTAVRTSNSGFVVAGTVGYDVRKGDVVFGVEGEISATTAKETDLLPAVDVKAGRDLYAGARLGVVVNPATLVYVKAGYTNGRLTVVQADDKLSHDFNGYRIGAGVERAIRGNVYAKAEYRYSNYEYNGNRHTGLVGLGYRF